MQLFTIKNLGILKSIFLRLVQIKLHLFTVIFYKCFIYVYYIINAPLTIW